MSKHKKTKKVLAAEKKPLVSVVVSTYNSRRTIEKCLQSIQDQSYPNLEIIVVDGLAYDPEEKKKCQKIIKKYATYIEDGPERSIQRNRGITEAKGTYIYIVDQDMYLTKDVVKECVETIQSTKAAALVIPEISIGDGFWTECVALERYLTVYLESNPNECARFFKKSDALSIDMYDPTIVGAEDSDFHYRMSKLGPIVKTKQHVWHDEGKTDFWGRVKKKYYYSQAFRKYLQRYPSIAPIQFFPIKLAYFKHWRLLLKQPVVTIGMFALRISEVLAGLLGILVKR